MRKSFPMVMVVVVCVCGLAEGPVRAADAQIQQIIARLDVASYRGFLNDDLYAHDGDNRGFVWNSGAARYEPAAQHDLARNNILAHFNSLGLAGSLDPFSFSSGGKTYAGANNVIGVLTGATTPGQYVIIGGHYDSVQNPGADDNASGVAAVMEAARIMSRSTFDTSIMFVAWDAEERGLKGSWDWVNTNGVSSITAVFNLDMLAYNDAGLDTASLYGSAAWTAAMTTAAAEYVPSLTINNLGAGKPWSDHWPFENNGVFAGGIIENMDPAHDNPHYHTAADSYDTAGYLDFDYAIDLLSVAVASACDRAGVVSEPATLVWDGTGPGEWTSAHWSPGPVVPGGGEAMVVNSDMVTVSSDLTITPGAAYSLDIARDDPGGTVSIGTGGKLLVTGDVNVGTGGTLSIDGVLTAAAVNITGGSLTNSSGSAATITVNGNVTLAGGTTFCVEAAGGGIDGLDCSGTVTLDGASLDITPAGLPGPALGDTLPLVSADGGLGGIFDSVNGVLHAPNQAFAVTYQPNGATVTVVRPGDFEVDGDVDFNDFTYVAANYGQTGKSWIDGDCDGNGTVEFADFTYLAANFGSDTDSPAEAPPAGTAELHVDVVTGEMRLVGDGATLSGYSIASATRGLIPDGDGDGEPAAFQLYLSNLAADISAGSIGAGVLIDGELALGAACDTSGPMDLTFSYGAFGRGGSLSGKVVVVPEPAALSLLALVGGLAALRRRREL